MDIFYCECLVSFYVCIFYFLVGGINIIIEGLLSMFEC